MPMTLEALQVVFLFIVPGFIIDRILALKHLRIQRETTDTVLTYVAWSGVNAAFVAPILLVELPGSPYWWIAVRLVISLVLGPAVVGLLISSVTNSQPYRRFIMKIGAAVHPHPKAWDHVFSSGTGYWVRVTLGDGTVIAGKYGQGSFVSSYPHPEDIYIDTVYELDEDNWFACPRHMTQGMLIRGEKIATIEFFEGGIDDAGQEGTDHSTDRSASAAS